MKLLLAGILIGTVLGYVGHYRIEKCVKKIKKGWAQFTSLWR